MDRLEKAPLSCSQLNQLLALAHQAEVSPGFFKYYWLSEPSHPYDLTRLPHYHSTYGSVEQILSIDQLAWGLRRIYTDSLLYFGSIRQGFRMLRGQQYDQLQDFFAKHRFDSDALIHRGDPLPLMPISKDDRYLIAEQACKSFDAPEGKESELLFVLKGAWADHVRKTGGGRISAKQLLQGAFVLNGYQERQGQFMFSQMRSLKPRCNPKRS